MLRADASDRHSEQLGWLAQLPRTYGYLAALRCAEAHGFQVTEEEVEQDGTRRLVLRR